MASQIPKEPIVYWKSDLITLYVGDAKSVLDSLPEQSVDCIVTSPPYYGQRDYGHKNQIGLEETPLQFITKLVEVFHSAHRVLKDTGSLWVNIGDTYWSGKGKPTRNDEKAKYRRFERPQDRTNAHPICKPKQLLLVPHRFAIAMQEDGWIVRNDAIWHKLNPTPDPVSDRLASAHEFMFFFVKRSKGYFFDRQAIAIPTVDGKGTKSPATVWDITRAPTFKKHIAPFPDELIRIPLHACLPKNGLILDPFCGSSTTLKSAVAMRGGRRAIGIDISRKYLRESVKILNTKQK